MLLLEINQVQIGDTDSGSSHHPASDWFTPSGSDMERVYFLFNL